MATGNFKTINKGKTHKQFRKYLNEEFKDSKWKHNRFHQRTRGYGDYLYYQDRDMFLDNFKRWVVGEGIK